MSPRIGLLARGFRRSDPQRFPSLPRLVVEWLERGRFPLTVAGPRRFLTGLPCYALTGIREITQLSTAILTAGWLAVSI
ncbi:MAG: hypothetical protein OJF50_000327 [Nitrospira sp.]|jgi:hypothetical protein|nr:hypothetical protein [Nitrospira sp.]